MRTDAAIQLAEFSDLMISQERPAAMLALKNMITMGTEPNEFLFGLHALGRVASGELPYHVARDIPFTKKDAVEIVLDSCSLDWPSEKMDQVRILKAGVKAITAIAGGEQVQCKLLEGLSRKSETSRIVTLMSIYSLDMHTPEAIQKVALLALDNYSIVQMHAEETFRKISRFGHPIRNTVLCNTPREARNAAEFLLNQNSQDIGPFKALAVVSFLRGTEKGNGFINLLLERNLLREIDIKKHVKEARESCSTSEMKAMLGRRKRQLSSKIFAMQFGQSALGTNKVPSIYWTRNRARKPSGLLHRNSKLPRAGVSDRPGKLIN